MKAEITESVLGTRPIENDKGNRTGGEVVIGPVLNLTAETPEEHKMICSMFTDDINENKLCIPVYALMKILKSKEKAIA